MTRLLYWFYRRVVVGRRWLRRRFTVAGGSVVAGWLMISMLAGNPGQAVAYQAWVLLGVLLLFSVGAAARFRLRVEVRRRLPRFATFGEPLRYGVEIVNGTGKVQRGLEYLEFFRGEAVDYRTFLERTRPGRRNRNFQLSAPLPPLDPARMNPAPVPPIAPGGRVEAKVELVPLRRGPLHFLGARLGRPDPLGLFRALHRVPLPGTVLVLPRRYPVPALALPGATRYQHGGVAFAGGVGESEEFVGVREYRPGDSLRRIDWRATARMDRPVVREYQDEFFVRHALVLDTFGDASTDGLFEDAVSVAASFACTVPDQDSLLDLLFVGPKTVCMTTGRGVGQVEQMLEVLACAQPCRDGGRFAELEDLVLRHSARVSGCVLVLLEWDEPRRRLVRRLKARQIPIWVLRVVAPGEKETAPLGSPADTPDRWVVIEQGQVAEALRKLGA